MGRDRRQNKTRTPSDFLWILNIETQTASGDKTRGESLKHPDIGTIVLTRGHGDGVRCQDDSGWLSIFNIAASRSVELRLIYLVQVNPELFQAILFRRYFTNGQDFSKITFKARSLLIGPVFWLLWVWGNAVVSDGYNEWESSQLFISLRRPNMNCKCDYKILLHVRGFSASALAVFKRSVSNISLPGCITSHNFIDYLQLNMQQFNSLMFDIELISISRFRAFIFTTICILG